jgi:hypothetical protein
VTGELVASRRALVTVSGALAPGSAFGLTPNISAWTTVHAFMFSLRCVISWVSAEQVKSRGFAIDAPKGWKLAGTRWTGASGKEYVEVIDVKVGEPAETGSRARSARPRRTR